MNRLIIKISKIIFIFTIFVFLFIFIHDIYLHFFENKSEIFEYETFDFTVNHNEASLYNYSFDGFNYPYIKNLKKVFDYEKSMGSEYFEQRQIANNTPIIIWWTPFTMNMGSYRTCHNNKSCFFTNIRKYRLKQNPKAFMFYGTDFYLHDLPLPRQQDEDWALLHEESPKNNYLFSFEKIMSLFNHTATFKRESDLTLLTQYLTNIDDLESTEYLVSTKDKNKFQKELNLAPIAYIQSDCVTPSDRDLYVKALMKYIKIDSYGKCLHNKDLPKNLTNAVESMFSNEFYKIIAKYKFVLAMENAVCDDYVTEKLWRSFQIGSVPIIYGSSRSRDIFPDENTAIEIKDFQTPEKLAYFIHMLNNNDTEYEQYLRFKTKNGVKNKYLLDLMSKRKWGINNDRIRGNYIDHFECLICERLYENLKRKKSGQEPIRYQAKKEHYGCPKPYTFNQKGILLNDTSSNEYQPSSFLTSYELAYINQKLFFEKYFLNFSKLTYKSLNQEAIEYHYELFSKKNFNFDLK